MQYNKQNNVKVAPDNPDIQIKKIDAEMERLGMESERKQLADDEQASIESLNKKWMPSIVSKLAISIGVSSAIGTIAGGVSAFFGAKKAGIGNAGKGFLTSGGAIGGGIIGYLLVTKLFKRITISTKAQQAYSEAQSELATEYTRALQAGQNRNLPVPDTGIVEMPVSETPEKNMTRYAAPRSSSFTAQADIEKTQAMQTVRTVH